MADSIFATGIPFIGRGSDEDHALFSRELYQYHGCQRRCAPVWLGST